MYGKAPAASLLTVISIALAAQAGSDGWIEFSEETTLRLLKPDGTYYGSDSAEKDFAWGDVDNDGDIDLVVMRKVESSQPCSINPALPNSMGHPKAISHPRVYWRKWEVVGVWQGFRRETARIPQLCTIPDGLAAGPIVVVRRHTVRFQWLRSPFGDMTPLATDHCPFLGKRPDPPSADYSTQCVEPLQPRLGIEEVAS